MSTSIAPGDRVEPFALESLSGQAIHVPDPEGRLVHLQFRRFAGCPVCNLHLQSVAARVGDLEAAGLVEVALFHSTAEQMLPYQHALPFHVVVDPEKALYRRFGVRASLGSVMHPGAWSAMTRGLLRAGPLSALKGSTLPLGLPGDFLIDADGVVVAAKYGAHADDQWSVDEILAHAAAAST